ncbi:MAG: alpha/beta fold hydrolase [Planctomycetota bacterium]|nr:alpha/beta fold hydrolase [Planctomycetota bacterium]
MRTLSLFTALACALLPGCSAPPAVPEKGESVIFVHGLGRTSASMETLASRVEDAGYQVINFGYPSTSESIEQLTERLSAEVERSCGEERDHVHFVTHSMGGVLVRNYLSLSNPQHEGRVVMLSPPNQGSEIIDAFSDSPRVRSILGPAAMQLGTGEDGIAKQLGPVRFSLGVIMGDRSLSPLGSWLIPGPDDGKVAVDRAAVEGAVDFIVLHATHTFIMNRRDVAEEVLNFLEHGRFIER